MKTLFPLLLLAIAACSQTGKKKAVEPVQVSDKEIQECREYQSTILDKGYKEVKSDRGIELVFENDTTLARKYLGGFEAEKSLTQKRATLVQNIISDCSAETLKKFDEDYKRLGSCQVMFSELNYFQSLASALHKYPWPTDLKLEGKKVALDYVRYYAEGQFPLLNRLVALSVLDELSVNQVVNKDLHQKIKLQMEEAQAYVEGLRQKLNRDPRMTCDGLDIIRDELAYSDKVAAKMKEFLNKI